MAINNYFDNTDINIYFHMKNHYKKVKSARSIIDNSFPQSFKTFSTPPCSGRSLKRTNLQERYSSFWIICIYTDLCYFRDIRNDPHLPSHSITVRKHSCITSASGNSDTSINLPRPKSRKSPFKMKV